MNGKRWWIASSILLLMLLVGCQRGPTAEEIITQMREVEASTEDVHAVVVLSGQVEELEFDVVVEAWQRKPDDLRLEVLEASGTDAAGVVAVSDGLQVWLYHPGENEVLTGNVDDLGADASFDPRQLLQFMEAWIQWILDHYDVELLGEEELNGVATYQLLFTPKPEEETQLPIPLADTAVTLWVEQERWIVLQAHLDGGSLGEGWVRVRSFELNQGLSDDRFQFTVPDDAQVIQIEDTRPIPLTLEEARAQAPFLLLVPTDVPEGATLIDVFATGDTYVLRYDLVDGAFTVVQHLDAGGTLSWEEMAQQYLSGEAAIDVQTVAVQDQEATLVADGAGNRLLTWVMDGVSVTIAGRIDQDQILAVAESLQ